MSTLPHSRLMYFARIAKDRITIPGYRRTRRPISGLNCDYQLDEVLGRQFLYGESSL